MFTKAVRTHSCVMNIITQVNQLSLSQLEKVWKYLQIKGVKLIDKLQLIYIVKYSHIIFWGTHKLRHIKKFDISRFSSLICLKKLGTSILLWHSEKKNLSKFDSYKFYCISKPNNYPVRLLLSNTIWEKQRFWLFQRDVVFRDKIYCEILL
jgi:hypothetical protein